MSTWLQSFPAGRGEFMLVSDVARQHGVMTRLMVERLRQAGVDPELICGVWMARTVDIVELDAPAQPREHKSLSSRLADQAADIETLRQRINELQTQLGGKA